MAKQWYLCNVEVEHSSVRRRTCPCIHPRSISGSATGSMPCQCRVIAMGSSCFCPLRLCLVGDFERPGEHWYPSLWMRDLFVQCTSLGIILIKNLHKFLLSFDFTPPFVDEWGTRVRLVVVPFWFLVAVASTSMSNFHSLELAGYWF